MIAITSHRKLEGGETEFNQVAAGASFNKAFDHVIYMGGFEPKLSTPTTTFTPCDDWPSIRSMCEILASFNDWGCLVNSDIVVSPEFTRVEQQLRAKNAHCAVSHRWEFEVTNPVKPKKVVDNGLDIFCAVPEVWAHAAREIPADFRIGHQRWDTWMIGFMNSNYAASFYDFTKSKVIFHPRHEGRKFGHAITGHIPFAPETFGMPIPL